MAVDGVALTPRLRIGTVPMAARAFDLDCVGCVATGAIADGAVTDEKIDSVSASKVTGVLDASRLPSFEGTKVQARTLPGDRLVEATVGTPELADGSVTDAKLDTVSAARLTGTIDAARIPVLDGTKLAAGSVQSSHLAAGLLDHSHSAADVGALSIAGGTLTGALSGTTARFSGEIVVGDSTVSCTSGAAGTVRFSQGSLYLCDGTFWRELQPKSRFTRHQGAWRLADGRAAANCKAYRDSPDYGDEDDDRYWIDPDGEGGNLPFVVRCDMTTAGGGWMVWEAREAPWWTDGVTCFDRTLFTGGDLRQMASVGHLEFRIDTDANFHFEQDDSGNPGEVWAARPDLNFAEESWHFRGISTNHMSLAFAPGDPTRLRANCSEPHSCGTGNWPEPGLTTEPLILTRIHARPTCDGATTRPDEWERNTTRLNGSYYRVLLR